MQDHRMMRNKIADKLNSNSGESIVETLVAVLIAAFALLMLAGTINTASSLITKSQSTLEDYYSKNNDVEGRKGTSTTANVTLTVEGGAGPSFSSLPDVKLYRNDKFSSKPVIAYDVAASP